MFNRLFYVVSRNVTAPSSSRSEAPTKRLPGTFSGREDAARAWFSIRDEPPSKTGTPLRPRRG